MNIDKKVILDQIDIALDRFNKLRSGSKYNDCSDRPFVDVIEVLTLLTATIEHFAPPGSRYLENTDSALKKRDGNDSYNLLILPGILRALRTDYEAGYLQSINELIHAEVFTGFLEMADYLFEEGYKDPSAVIGGGVLEEQLRKLCQKNGIQIVRDDKKPKKAESMNSELAIAKVYSLLDQKSITSWLDLRNKAAHGKYGEYSKDQVKLMILGIRDFISRNPA